MMEVSPASNVIKATIVWLALPLKLNVRLANIMINKVHPAQTFVLTVHQIRFVILLDLEIL